MQFTSIDFLFGFLPLTLIVYWLLKSSVRSYKVLNGFLVIVSLLFYSLGSLSGLFILLFVLLWNYVCAAAFTSKRFAMSPAERRIQLIVCVAVNLTVLIVYKYLPVWFGTDSAFLGSLIVPVGLSFYMFSCLSYVFDVYRGKETPCSLMDFALFAAFFGRVNMGPIAHYAKMKDQLNNHPVKKELLLKGSALFLQGLVYKVVLADNFALVFDALKGNTSWMGNLLFGFSYFFQLYFDFCGYSRMARGLGAFFGFDIPANFKQPYQAISVQDFWRRWHISLTDWFRDNVYIPLGGNRVSRNRWILNILAVWLLTGVWHGATLTFLVWGLYQGALILLEKFWLNKVLEKAPGWIRHACLVITQLIGWTFFSADSMMAALATIGRYVGIGIAGFADGNALFALSNAWLLFIVAIILCTNLMELLSTLCYKLLGSKSSIAGAAAYGFMFMICVAMIVSSTSQTFLYAAF